MMVEFGDGFWFYDLKVEIVLDGCMLVCWYIEGESFVVEGEVLVFFEG